MPVKKRRGAPPKPPKDKKDAHITCWMTDEQKALMVRAAEAQGDAPGTWLRKAGESAARSQLGEEKGK
jgi:uncharacterized protein (DUF1778 family)